MIHAVTGEMFGMQDSALLLVHCFNWWWESFLVWIHLALYQILLIIVLLQYIISTEEGEEE